MNTSAYEHILARFSAVSRKYLLTRTFEAAAWSCAVLTANAGITVLVESFFYLRPEHKTFLLYACGVIALVTGAVLVIRSVLRRPGPVDIARLVERRYPGLNDRLISAVQLGGPAGEGIQGQSRELIDALLDQVVIESAKLNLACAVPSGTMKKAWRYVFGAWIVLLGAALVFPGTIMSGLWRCIDYQTAYTAPDATSIYLTPTRLSILRGDSYTAAGFMAGSMPGQLNLLVRWDDAASWTIKPVPVDRNTGAFTFTVEKPQFSFQYYLETDGIVSGQYRVTVIERPELESITLALSYPAYTGLGTQARDDNDGSVRALKGTTVNLTAVANKPLREMSLVWSDSTVTRCRVEGMTGMASFVIDRTVDYHISLADTLGIANEHPITYRVTCLADNVPVVSILSPATDTTLPASMVIPIIYRASDDYGLTMLSLEYQLPFEKTMRSVTLLKRQQERTVENVYDWDLSGVNLLPGDSFTFRLVVYDNDTVDGPKKGVSETRTIRLPSMADMFSDTVKEQNTGIEKLRRLSEEAGRNDEELKDISRSFKSGRELEWSDKNKIDEAKKHLETMQKDIREVTQSIEQAAEKLSDEQVLALETVEKMRRISSLMNEIADGDIKEALKLLTHAQIQIDPGEVKQLLDRYVVTAEDIKKRLDRIIGLMEQIKSIQNFEAAKNLLEDMAVRQAKMAEKYRLNSGDIALPREEKSLAGEMEKLQDEMKSVARDIRERFKIGTEELEGALDTLDVAEMKRRAASDMEHDAPAEAEEKLDRSNTMISGLLEKMDTVGMRMNMANSEELKRRLYTALNELLVVSEGQESLATGLNTLDGESGARRQLDIIEALGKAERSLRRVGELTIDLAGPIDRLMSATRMLMEVSVDECSKGNMGAGGKNAREALAMVNNTIYFLTTILRKSPDGMGLPGDMIQQLQDIANGQLSLQQMMSGENMEQLAAEQEKLAQMLNSLTSKLLEDPRMKEMLEKLVEDMDDTARMMRRNEKREIVERNQFDIYRRLLDARRSKRKKDESTERKSWTAKRNISLGADELAPDLGEKQKELNERMKEALSDDFDPAYRELIRRYFESLMSRGAGGEP